MPLSCGKTRLGIGFILESGVVGVYTDGASGLVQLGKLGAGDRFGAVSLQSSIRRKRVLLKALTPVVAMTLKADHSDHLTTISPAFRAELASALGFFYGRAIGAMMQAKAQMTQSGIRRPVTERLTE